MKNAILLSNKKEHLKTVYPEYIRDALPLFEGEFSCEDIKKEPEKFRDTEFIFSTWGMPIFTNEEIKEYFPALRAVFYGAGTVQSFAKPFLSENIRVFSAWQANAVPVAEFTLAQILLASKQYFSSAAAMSVGDLSSARTAKSGIKGNFGVKVGIIGVGVIGSLVIKLLQPFSLKILVFDAFKSEEEIAALGAETASLEKIFEECSVVSNHLANKPATVNMLNYSLFKKMKKNAAFINTGRGAQVDEEGLIRLLTERPDITALLDVTSPEPPIEGSPLYDLKNCFLSPHIAGSLGNEVARMGEYMKSAYEKFIKGKELDCEVDLEMLKTMA